MVDEGCNDIWIEVVLVKLWFSEMVCLVGDELLQICGGCGYEIVEFFVVCGEWVVLVEQMVWDLWINWIFEGFSEIMWLFIVCEVVDVYFIVVGDLVNFKVDLWQKVVVVVGVSGFYVKWLLKLVFGEG